MCIGINKRTPMGGFKLSCRETVHEGPALALEQPRIPLEP